MFSSREGVTIDSVARPLRRWLLNPNVTVPLALILAWQPIFSRLATYLASAQAIRLRSRAYALALLSVALSINDYLNRRLANNWVVDSRWNWNEEVVVVTGGSSGVGAGICQELLARNCRTRIAVIDIALLSWSPPAHSRLRYYQCDLSDAAAIRATCERIREEIGNPTVLFNNAGLVRGATIMEGSYADVELTMRINLTAPFLLVKEFLPDMVRRDHGHIVHTGSMSSLIPPANIADYAASKAGITALHEALQLELKNVHKARKIRLTLGIFSHIRTPLINGDTGQSNFLYPMLHVDSVSEKLVDAVYSGEGKTIYMPGMMRYISMFKGGPEWFFRIVRNRTSRIDIDYTGRQEIDSETGMLRRT